MDALEGLGREGRMGKGNDRGRQLPAGKLSMRSRD